MIPHTGLPDCICQKVQLLHVYRRATFNRMPVLYNPESFLHCRRQSAVHACPFYAAVDKRPKRVCEIDLASISSVLVLLLLLLLLILEYTSFCPQDLPDHRFTPQSGTNNFPGFQPPAPPPIPPNNPRCTFVRFGVTRAFCVHMHVSPLPPGHQLYVARRKDRIVKKAS
jgi:hypothetical protein